MYLYWWVVFFINILFAVGIMLTYLSRSGSEMEVSKSKEPAQSPAKTLVIVPAKGIDYELEKNLISLRDQTYERFDLIAVVDADTDPAVESLRKVGIKHMESTDICTDCSGKVRAIYSALVKYPDYELYVVADSDIRAERSWLANLLVPLSDPTVGVSTTFPIFYPEGGFWSKFKMFWGMVGQSMMESRLTRFVWGGSMAFRKDILDDTSLELLSHSISDDIAILRIARSKGLGVSYVPEARPKIYSKDDFPTFMEWADRQTAFSIYSTNKTFSFGMTYYLVSIYLMVSSIVLSVFVSVLFAVFLFPYFFNSFNSYRKAPVKVWYFLLLTFLLPFVYVFNLMSGMFRKRVVWRGNTYFLSKN